ncbi:YjdF family protein [Bacillus sp. 1P06AnD]
MVHRHLFGVEPSNEEILLFVHDRLQSCMDRTIPVDVVSDIKKKSRNNPKRAAREAAKEMKKKGISTKSQEIVKESMAARKEWIKTNSKAKKEEHKAFIWQKKMEKRKKKHRGH